MLGTGTLRIIFNNFQVHTAKFCTATYIAHQHIKQNFALLPILPISISIIIISYPKQPIEMKLPYSIQLTGSQPSLSIDQPVRKYRYLVKYTHFFTRKQAT
jgi:hypothetical protein